MAQVDPWDDSIPRELKGIRGLLLLPLLQLIATPFLIVMFAAAPLRAHPPATTMHNLLGDPVFLAVTALVYLLMLVQLIYGLFCLVQFFRKKLWLPDHMTLWYGLGIVISVLMVIQFAVDPDLFVKTLDATATSGGLKFHATQVIVVNGITILYFGISQRVKNTFVR
jgi:hypothetical protein